MGIESWTLQEIHLFANTLDFLDHEFIFIFFKRVSKLLEYYIQFEKGREVYCGLLINIIEYTFVKNQYEFAEVLLTQLGLLSTSFQDFFSRTLYKFFEGLLIMRTVNEEQGRTMATRMLDIMVELDQAPLSKMFSLLLE
jgi:Rgg/GadR/MutR family transcriptional activator